MTEHLHELGEREALAAAREAAHNAPRSAPGAPSDAWAMASRRYGELLAATSPAPTPPMTAREALMMAIDPSGVESWSEADTAAADILMRLERLGFVIVPASSPIDGW